MILLVAGASEDILYVEAYVGVLHNVGGYL